MKRRLPEAFERLAEAERVFAANILELLDRVRPTV